MNSDKEIILASEEVNRKNITAVIEYSKQTRNIVRGLEKQIESYKNVTLQQKQELELLRSQIQKIQQNLYTGKITG